MSDLFTPENLERRLTAGQRAALARMTSRCTIRRDTGTTTTSPITGRQVKVWEVVHADLPCRVKRGNDSRTESSGGVEVQLATRELHFPHDVTGMEDGDLAEVTSGESAPSVWRLLDTEPADQQTAYRVPVVQIRRPVEWG